MARKNMYCPHSEELQAKFAVATEQQTHSLTNLNWEHERAARALVHGNCVTPHFYRTRIENGGVTAAGLSHTGR